MATAAILGCAGYAGQETLDRVLAHPELEPVALGSDSLAGRRASSLDPRLNGDLPAFVTNAEARAAGADVVFMCLGHEQALGFPVCFVPHLLPVRRGLLVTCYVQPLADLRGLLEDAYGGSPVVRVLDDGVAPELSRVQHTDAAEIALYEDRATGRAVV